MGFARWAIIQRRILPTTRNDNISTTPSSQTTAATSIHAGAKCVTIRTMLREGRGVEAEGGVASVAGSGFWLAEAPNCIVSVTWLADVRSVDTCQSGFCQSGLDGDKKGKTRSPITASNQIQWRVAAEALRQ